MTVKMTPPSPRATLGPEEGLLTGRWQAPRTTAEYVQHIETLGQRITGYVQFMCKAGELGGTSAEAKEKTVAAFWERIAALERQLKRIYEELRLG
jgi:hypothetical protein